MKLHIDDREGAVLASRYQVKTFARSFRKCMDPVDYVYGVLGILNVYMPRMIDADQVWQHFLEMISSSMPISDRARQFNLATAQSMADVYKNLL